MVELVKAGIGVALMPGCAVVEELANGAVAGRPINGMRIVWSVAFDGQRQPSGIVERVQVLMQELAGDLTRQGIWTPVAAPRS